MKPLLVGVVLTMVMAIFETWSTWATYTGFEDFAKVELRLDRLSGVIVHLDEVLTMSARMCAVTGRSEWETRYRHYEPALDAAIQETIAIAPGGDVRQAAMRTETANLRLVEFEHEALDLVSSGRQEEARRLLFSPEYEVQKAVYASAISQCKSAIERRVDAQLHWLLRRAVLGLALTAAALVALGFGWAKVLELVRRSNVERIVLLGRLEDAVQARDEFISIASHELKTPLTTLKLQIDGLNARIRGGRTPDETAKLERKMTLVERQVNRLSALIDELLDTSRITSGRMVLSLEEDVDLSEVIQDAVVRFKDELVRASCEVHVRGIDRPILGCWDRLRLDQVLSNLIGNALKYGAGRPIEVEADANEHVACFSVRDHGIGISPDRQGAIFQRFERAVSERDYGGFGLGLWIVREIACAMGGDVSVTSRLGEGATFRVVLPRRMSDESS